MKSLLPVSLLALVVAGCGSSQQVADDSSEQMAVQGTRISKSEFEEGELKPVERKEGESQMQMLLRVLGDLPGSGDYDNCKELLEILEQRDDIKIVSVAPAEVKAKSGGTTMTYEFTSDECT